MERTGDLGQVKWHQYCIGKKSDQKAAQRQNVPNDKQMAGSKIWCI